MARALLHPLHPALAAALSALCAGAALAAGDAPVLQVRPEQERSLALRTARPEPAREAGRVVLQGQVTLPADRVRVLSAPAAASIEQVRVARGDAVVRGQPLLELASPQVLEWQREWHQARLQVDLARQTARRDQDLLAQGIIPASRAQASDHQRRVAEALLHEREQVLRMAGGRPGDSGRLVLKAPDAGHVVELMAQAGQRVDVGAPLLRLQHAGAPALDLAAPADVARRLRVGDAVHVKGCDTPARLTSITPRVEAATQTQALRAQWPAPTDCVVAQQHVEADVALAAAGAAGTGGWVLPASALVKLDGRDVLFVRRPAGFAEVTVRVIARRLAQGAEVATWGAGAELAQVDALRASDLGAADAVVVQGAAALKGLAQGLGAP